MRNQKSETSNRHSPHCPLPTAHGPRPTAHRPLPTAHCPPPSAHRPPPTAFTLVELLVTVSIIAILASLLLGALYTAQDQARAIKTKSTIAKLNTIIMARWETYKTRRVPITIPAGTQPNVAAAMRLAALRELMILEMPERNTEIPDLSDTQVTLNNVGVSGNTISIPRPSVSYAYKRRLGTPADNQYASAECLYLIVTNSQNDDENGRESFGESEVGDIDNDGRSEFHDAWGNPISFMRWPAGFVSELQPHDPVNYHDPFDQRRVHSEAYALYPLIFSSGPDGKNELNNSGGDPSFVYPKNSIGFVDPYPPKHGTWTDQDSDTVNDSLDNIHNHLIGTR
jgi:prepilin-type N-terminal cleavage/methylation domain-containing protein